MRALVYRPTQPAMFTWIGTSTGALVLDRPGAWLGVVDAGFRQPAATSSPSGEST